MSKKSLSSILADVDEREESPDTEIVEQPERVEAVEDEEADAGEPKGGEGFANVGDAMPVTPELVERYHQTARDVAAQVVLLPGGFRFSPSTERPDWTEEALRPLRSFHALYAGPNGDDKPLVGCQLRALELTAPRNA